MIQKFTSVKSLNYFLTYLNFLFKLLQGLEKLEKNYSRIFWIFICLPGLFLFHEPSQNSIQSHVGIEQLQVHRGTQDSDKRNWWNKRISLRKTKNFDLIFHRKLMKGFPDWKERINFQKKQEEYHKSAIRKKKDNFLRFEFEIKGNFIQDLQSLLLEQRFEEFEQILSYQFFKHSFKLFHSSTQSYHLDWLMDRLRPYQHRNLLTSQIEVIPSHYIKQFTFKEFQDKLDLITFFQFLVYARGLKYKADSLGSTHYRLVQLRVQDFLHYTKRSNNYYQLDKLIKFFDQLQQNSLIQVFSDNAYRGIVTIPEVNLFKTSYQSWLAEIWMAEELFTYLHPFLFNDFFQDKLTKYQFQVLFEIVKVFSSSNVRKEFNIQQFIHSYPSTLNGKLKIKIKEHFIQYLQVLEKQPKIKAKVLLLPSNEIHNIHQLTYNHLRKNKTIVAFEIIDIKFI